MTTPDPTEPAGTPELREQTAAPDAACEHMQLSPAVSFEQIRDEATEEVLGLVVSLQVRCGACGEEFRFTGAPVGMSGEHPTVSLDEGTLLAPLRPASADRDFGLGVPGYAVSPWAARPQEQVKTVIQRAITTPQAYALILPNEGRHSHRARAVMKVLEDL
jgi:hypothetical protein